MSRAPLVHLNGWPGTGKRTVALALAARIGARVLHSHLVLDPASALFERGTPERAALRERLRATLYEAAVGLPPEVPLIVTDALAATDAGAPLIETTLHLARARGGLVPFVLEVGPEENARRLADPARAGTGKLTDPSVLADLRRRHALLRLPGARSVNVTDLSAEAAADRLAAMLA
ncbi:hypothetical protein JQC91_15265 [Jannaschia sp. Os4]|uniref:hypothetical protein n=1 Tax=Jannaschia sp. Os4 TaxID=2807617 RepID=UPI001939D656|nr:hypothetical protein [Jannaschia sp. Os4]MBM2577665.1 hypothetical protein [Jannaschia sp. Os4]